MDDNGNDYRDEYSTKTCLDNLALIYANLSNQTNLSELAIIYLD